MQGRAIARVPKWKDGGEGRESNVKVGECRYAGDQLRAINVWRSLSVARYWWLSIYKICIGWFVSDNGEQYECV